MSLSPRKQRTMRGKARPGEKMKEDIISYLLSKEWLTASPFGELLSTAPCAWQMKAREDCVICPGTVLWWLVWI